MAFAWRHHARRWKNNRYVYAVVSRRSRGISIGLNLNPKQKPAISIASIARLIAKFRSRSESKPEELSAELDMILQQRKADLYTKMPL